MFIKKFEDLVFWVKNKRSLFGTKESKLTIIFIIAGLQYKKKRESIKLTDTINSYYFYKDIQFID